MNITKTIKIIMLEHNISQAALAHALGGMSSQATSKRITHKNQVTSVLSSTLHALRYKLVVMPEEMEAPKGCFDLDDFEDTKKEPDTL